MKNSEIADLFTRMGSLLEIRGDNVFKVKAYFKAADQIRTLAEDIEQIRSEERLGDIPGVGKTLQEKIGEWLDTGRLAAYDKLVEEVPETLLDVMSVPSVGPKKAKLFFDKLAVKSLKDLTAAAKSGELEDLPGVQKKTVEKILAGIQTVESGQDRMLLNEAFWNARFVINALKDINGVRQIDYCGSLRRGRETVRDIDILVDAKDAQSVMDAFVKLHIVKSINAHGETKSSIMTKRNVQIDLRVVDQAAYGAALMYFTGSKNFNIKLRQIAIQQKRKINEYGVFDVSVKKEKCLASRTEKECFKALDLPYIPPELREDIGMAEIFEGDAVHSVPKLVELKDIRGEIHVHSQYSDGKNTVAEMAERAEELGYEYLAVSDHSQALKVARGVSVEDLRSKREEIDEINQGYQDLGESFRVLCGSEVEIDSDGNLDYDDDILRGLDIVVAAIHTGLTQSRQQLTNRLIRACQNPHTNFIAHPFGIHRGKREPYDIDFEEVCRAAVDNNVCLEINSFPHRLDLESEKVYFARKLGVKFVINTDAHSTEHMDYMPLGVGVARRGWLTKHDVVNTFPLRKLLKHIQK